MTGADDVAALHRSNVLLVDDEPSNLLALEAVLQPLNQTLVRATSGQEALHLLQSGDFAVVLLDVQMRKLDGFETARRLRAQERSRHTPIIFLTAYEKRRLPGYPRLRAGRGRLLAQTRSSGHPAPRLQDLWSCSKRRKRSSAKPSGCGNSNARRWSPGWQKPPRRRKGGSS